MKMPEECRVIKVTNVAPAATKDQLKTLFGYIGKILDIVLYPELETTPVASRVCYLKFEYPEDVGVSLHLSNTVFIDRALGVAPVPEGKIPDEKSALAAQTNVNSESAGDIHRTIYVSSLSSSITPEQLLHLFGTQAGEVKYIRMAGDAFGSRAAYVEFTEQASVMRALALTGQTLGDCLIHVASANTAITKPTTGMLGATSKELEQAMKKVDEAQPLISAVLDPNRRSRSGSRSRRSRSHRSRSRHRSRSKSRKRSRSRSHRSRRPRSRSKRRSRSPRRRKSRSRSRKRHSRSGSRDRRRRSKSRSPKSSKSRRSRSREKKKTDTKSRDGTPAESNKDVAKHDSDEKKTSRDSEKERKQSSRRRSRSPKPSSRRRSRSHSNSPSRSGRKVRDDRRRSQDRSKEKSSRSRSTREDAKEPDRHSSRGHNGHDGDSDHASAQKRPRDADHESDVDGNEPKMARNEDNASEGGGSHDEDED